MAGACGSGCYKAEEEEVEKEIENTGRTCYKCKVAKIIESTGGLCGECLDRSLFAKFKQAVSTQNLISPTDNVLLAFSGGPCSRVALEFVHEMQNKAQKNRDASRNKSYPVFGVGVAFIDETAVTSLQLDKAIQDLRMIVSSLAPPRKELHIMPIQTILSDDDDVNRLKELLLTVTDVTGKEDLLLHLRMLCLQKVALENNYNKLILGSCTSRIACHVLSATVKGQGYSLPADIQYADARWEIPVVLPLRDCVSQELNMLCRLNSLKTLDSFDSPRSGINELVSTFITLLMEENPARERTIVRTAEKLVPFQFNRINESLDSGDRRRRRKVNLKSYESISSEFLCPICCSPVNNLDLEYLKSKLESCATSPTVFGESCCPSCQFQILPKESSSMEHFYSLVPQQMITRVKDSVGGDQAWLREQIEDCLLSDGEDEV
ncbi:hypothetical protein IFM89_004268 [Coptis chinensis]|uniref:Cytoplasmic tRNA 2-thiolation protein 2 n=1 Tax=Coptis chinensis TaxID=261450 RepID=A0A835IA98_9MAGN|nr:hypothetical protein IFM89_004268 [Coptis chinensis]